MVMSDTIMNFGDQWLAKEKKKESGIFLSKVFWRAGVMVGIGGVKGCGFECVSGVASYGMAG